MTEVLEQIDRLIAQSRAPFSVGNPDDLLTVAEVAEWMKLSKRQIYVLAMPRTKVGGSVRFMRRHVLSYLRQGTEFPVGWRD